MVSRCISRALFTVHFSFSLVFVYRYTYTLQLYCFSNFKKDHTVIKLSSARQTSYLSRYYNNIKERKFLWGFQRLSAGLLIRSNAYPLKHNFIQMKNCIHTRCIPILHRNIKYSPHPHQKPIFLNYMQKVSLALYYYDIVMYTYIISGCIHFFSHILLSSKRSIPFQRIYNKNTFKSFPRVYDILYCNESNYDFFLIIKRCCSQYKMLYIFKMLYVYTAEKWKVFFSNTKPDRDFFLNSSY